MMKMIVFQCDECGIVGKPVKSIRTGWRKYIQDGWGKATGDDLCPKCWMASDEYQTYLKIKSGRK